MDSQLEAQQKPHGWLYAWLPVLIGVALIATTSSDWFSAKYTSGPFRWVYESLFGPVSAARWGKIHLFIRKGCHFSGYGVFGLLWLRAWWLSAPRFRFIQDALLALLGAGIVASLDEFHQTFLPLRTGSPWDVLLDCSGVVTAQLIVYIILRICKPGKLTRAQ